MQRDRRPATMADAEAGESGAKLYLAYLDKEMTIMGILTVFTVVVPAVVLEKTFGAEQGNGALLWRAHSWLIAFACLCLLMASLFFYRQRSDLAFWYGQIALSVSPGKYPDVDTQTLIQDADLWSAWRHYFRAFWFTTLAFVCYGLVLVAQVAPGAPQRTTETAPAIVIVMLVWYFLRARVFLKYEDGYKPWHCWWRTRWKGLFALLPRHMRQHRRIYDDCLSDNCNEPTRTDGATDNTLVNPNDSVGSPE